MEFPNVKNKIQQLNFDTYAKSREWLSNNGYKSVGMVLDEPWKEYFVERWEKEGLVALTMNVIYLPAQWHMKLPIKILENPYQIDIATV